MSQNPYESYLENQILSASPIELVEILYKAAIDSLELARIQLAKGDIRGRVAATTRATNIVVELVQSLDRERGGDLVQQLVKLYDYVLHRLQQANVEQDDAGYREVIQLLSTLLDGWRKIGQPLPAPPANAYGEREPIAVSF
jgi:flagellar protein FliS